MGVLRYIVKATNDANLPPKKGWKSHDGGKAPMPILEYPDDLLHQLALRKMLQMGAPGLPSIDVKCWFAHLDDAVLKHPVVDRFLERAKRVWKRRRLTSEPAGYRSPPADGCEPRSKVWSHDHAATRRHIRRLLESEAAGHA